MALVTTSRGVNRQRQPKTAQVVAMEIARRRAGRRGRDDGEVADSVLALDRPVRVGDLLHRLATGVRRRRRALRGDVDAAEAGPVRAVVEAHRGGAAADAGHHVGGGPRHRAAVARDQVANEVVAVAGVLGAGDGGDGVRPGHQAGARHAAAGRVGSAVGVAADVGARGDVALGVVADGDGLPGAVRAVIIFPGRAYLNFFPIDRFASLSRCKKLNRNFFYNDHWQAVPLRYLCRSSIDAKFSK